MQKLWKCCIAGIILWLGIMSSASGQMFDKNPTIYDHMKSGANTVKSNLIESELKVENLFMPEECKIDDDDFYGDRGDEISEARRKRLFITAEEGDTVTVLFTVALDDGTVLEKSVKESEELGQEDEITPAIFTMGYGRVIPGWELGMNGMCLGEKRKITIPPQLAYGSKGFKEKNIPPDVTLEIETELVYIKKKDVVDHYMDFIHNLHVYAFFILGLTFLMSGFYKGVIANKRRLYREIEERKRLREIEEEDEDDNEDDEGIDEEIEESQGKQKED